MCYLYKNKGMGIMNFYRHHWYDFGLVFFVLITFYMIFVGVYQLSNVQVILMANFMALLLHQFEEYRLPGGAAIVINCVLYGEKENYRRYPGNAQSSMIVNISAYVFYLLAIFFPQFVWLGLAQSFFGFIQVIGHGIVFNYRMKRWYNPGMLTAIFLHLPIGIYYIFYVSQHGLISCSDYLWGMVTLIIVVLVTIPLPILIYLDVQSPYEFTEEEASRYHIMNKIKEKGL